MKKKDYKLPKIEPILLDQNISLYLESVPPVLPGEEIVSVPEYFKIDPFNSGHNT